MKILFITPFLPINNGSGGAIRSYQLYEELRLFAQVDVLIANGAGISFPLLKEFKISHNYVGHIEIYWDQPFLEVRKSLHPALKDLLRRGKYDYVFIRYYNTAYWLGALALESLILDCDDCKLELLGQQKKIKAKNILERYSASFIKYVRRINYIRNISSANKVIFSKKSYEIEWRDNFYVVPNKISPIKIFDLGCRDSLSTKILFIGVLNYAPNIEGLDHFIEKIWPLVLEKKKNITLKIAGNFLPNFYKLKWQSCEGVEYVGFVENIEDAYGDVDFSIAPVYQGSGTHIKIMESLMRARPMVISKLAHRGYEDTLLDGDSLFVAQNDIDFAKKIILLAEDKKIRDRMGLTGYEKVLYHHSINRDSVYLRPILIESERQNSIQMEAANFNL